MKAMVLAAGEGRRLRPLTERVPKALVEVGGKAMLELVLRRLIEAGVTEAIVNVFHLADQVEAYLRQKKGFGIRVEVSREDVLLDTGGGLQKAAWFLGGPEPFLVHNVDILSDVDLRALHASHRLSGALATLAVHDRPGSRRLLFDGKLRLLGREKPGFPPPEGARALGFAGIHAVSPALFGKLTERGIFSITDAYVRLAAAGERVLGREVSGGYWTDIGGPDKLEAARRDAERLR